MIQIVQVAVATTLVAGSPVAYVWWERSSGRVSSIWLGLVLGLLCSLCASLLGCVVWEALPGHEDLLFSELMVWGYLRRLHTQRRLGCALDMVGPMGEGTSPDMAGLSSSERAKLLEELVSGIETSDPYLHGHSRRVARHSWMIARRMGLSSEEVARIRTAAAIHDVGKIHTPTAILHKPARLTDAEYDVIKKHPGDGALMADVLRDAALTSMVRHHHERLDGTGYPDALRGEEIPLGARIIAVADTFDAITSERPYRGARPHKKAIDILLAEAGTSLDPDVVHSFCGHYSGRTPVALTWLLTALPERAVSWLSGSVGAVATAAKVAAVAALVGGAAIASSTLRVSGSRHEAPASHSRVALSDDVPTGHAAVALANSKVHPTVGATSHRTHTRGRKRALARITVQPPAAVQVQPAAPVAPTAPAASVPPSSGSTAITPGSAHSTVEPATGGGHEDEATTTVPVATPPASGAPSEGSTESAGGGKVQEQTPELEAARAVVAGRRAAVEEAKAALGEQHAKIAEAQAILEESRAKVSAALAKGREHPFKLEEDVARAEEHLVRLEQGTARNEEYLAFLEADLARSEERLAKLEAAPVKPSPEESKTGRHPRATGP